MVEVAAVVITPVAEISFAGTRVSGWQAAKPEMEIMEAKVNQTFFTKISRPDGLIMVVIPTTFGFAINYLAKVCSFFD